MTKPAISNPETWVARHGDYLYRYAMKRLRNEKVAEDIVQETFLAALKARDNFVGQASERTWMVGILKNKRVDHFRKAGREADFHVEDQSVSDEDDYASSGPKEGLWKADRRPAAWSITPSDTAEQKEFWDYLNRCLDGLDYKFSLVFVLREIEEMATEEICNVLDITATNLRVILYRARKQLRACLETHWLERGKVRS